MVPEENRQRPLDILIQACEKPPSSRRFGSSPRETHDALTAGELLAWNNPVQVGSAFVVLCGAPVRWLSWFSSVMFHENVWMCVYILYNHVYIYIYIPLVLDRSATPRLQKKCCLRLFKWSISRYSAVPFGGTRSLTGWLESKSS